MTTCTHQEWGGVHIDIGVAERAALHVLGADAILAQPVQDEHPLGDTESAVAADLVPHGVWPVGIYIGDPFLEPDLPVVLSNRVVIEEPA